MSNSFGFPIMRSNDAAAMSSPHSTDCEGDRGTFTWGQTQSFGKQGPPILGKQQRIEKKLDAPPAKKARFGESPLVMQPFVPIPGTPEQQRPGAFPPIPPLNLADAASRGILTEDDDSDELASYDEDSSIAGFKDVVKPASEKNPLIECEYDCNCGGEAPCHEDCGPDCQIMHCHRSRYLDFGFCDDLLDGETFGDDDADDEN